MGIDMIWYDVEKETPEIGELVWVAFTTNIGTTQYTSARYVIRNYAQHCENYGVEWQVEVSRGHELRSVTHWANIDLAPGDCQDVPF